ncbi:uncharacterized protein EAF01_010168 [Botrytis porri]|uniref:uncharacterized protein n=1 Tax=Botrytis porri TaxID=87229 RepID=UPI001900DFD5|nr:uncharacterized protein EAF01_010168 [Botrytis porri]KAF7894718.1 hypothetical protein EAF01_010168 [Botrytis porri]
MPTSTQDECHAARLRLYEILDMPCYEFPTGYTTMCEMEGFRRDLKKEGFNSGNSIMDFWGIKGRIRRGVMQRDTNY